MPIYYDAFPRKLDRCAALKLGDDIYCNTNCTRTGELSWHKFVDGKVVPCDDVNFQSLTERGVSIA